MDRKTTDIVAYITIFGWLVAYVAGDKEDSRFHLNQALVINLTAIILAVLTRIPDRFRCGIAAACGICVLDHGDRICSERAGQ